MHRFCNKIDVSEGIDVIKITSSKKCITSHYWYILHKGFRSQPSVCNDCYELFTMSIDTNNIAILNINVVNYCCIIASTGKREAINLFKNFIY